MSDYLELEIYVDVDDYALLTVHPVIGDSFIIPRVMGNPVRHHGAWYVDHELNGKRSTALIPADDVRYFTVTDYAELLDTSDDWPYVVGDDEDIHLDVVTLENSDERLHVHDAGDCFGEVCSIHNRTDHSMHGFPQHWRGDRGIMERLCPHGVGHPDPDDYRIYTGEDSGVHGCDGCCVSEAADLTEELL